MRASDPDRRRPAGLAQRLQLAVEITIGPAVFFVAQDVAGLPTTAALLTAVVCGAGWTAAMSLRTRRPNPVSLCVLAGLGAGAALMSVNGDPAFAVLKDSIITAGTGIALLVSLATSRPLVHVLLRPLVTRADDPREIAEWDALIQVPPFHRCMRRATAVWGLGMILEACLRVGLVDRFSLPTAVALSPVLTATVVLVLAIWTRRHCKPIRAEAATLLAGESVRLREI